MNASRLHNELDLDAYWMPFTANRAFKSAPRMVISASGMTYRTDDGRELLDAMSGLWCCNAGHCHPRIAAAIASQAETLDYAMAFQMGHPTVFRLAERLAAMAPGDLGAVFFTNSGSESVDTALKIALAYHQANGEASRTRIVGRERGYHGVGFGGTSVGGIGNNRKSFGPLLPGVLHLPTNLRSRARQAFSRGQPEVGRASRRGTRAPGRRQPSVHHRRGHRRTLRRLGWRAGSTRRLSATAARDHGASYGILLIFDEVITAFGQAWRELRRRAIRGPAGSHHLSPRASPAAPCRWVRCWLRDHDPRHHRRPSAPDAIELFHGYTYSGHPLATAAALATLDVYDAEENLFARARASSRASSRRRCTAWPGKPHVQATSAT